MTSAAAFPQTTGPLQLQGAAGAIEAVVEWPAGELKRDVVGVVCHPHPLHGGTMANKVVTSAAQALRELGCATLRFNFRGVGGSAGEHDDGIGREHLVLTDQEGHGTLADVPRDARHGFVAFRGRLHLQVEDEGHDKGYGARAERLQV